LSGFGIYGLGLAHLIGSNAITLTSLLRQSVDAGTLKNFPGGLKKRGLRIENNDKAIGPSEFHEVETNDVPLTDCVMLMPYNEPSSVLIQLRQEIIQQAASLSSTAESEIPELGTNAPVGTTLAMLEVANKVQSSVLRSLHVSLGHELKLLFNLFGEYLEDQPYPFAVPGSSTAIMKQDFNDRINIVPVSDPNVLTSTHRLITAESILKLAQSAPDLHNLREVYKRMYSAMNVENVEKILNDEPQPVSLDPLTENAYFMLNKPVTIAMFQEDDNHIVAHKKQLEDQMVQSNPQIAATINLHIQQHKAYKALKQMLQQKQQQVQQTIQQAQQQMQMSQQQLQQSQMMGIPLMPDMIARQAQMEQSLQMKVQQEQMMLKQMQEQYQQMPPDQVQAMPEIQNMVASQDAQEINQQIQQQQQQMAQQEAQMKEQQEKQIDPNQVMLAEIAQRREASSLKDEEAKLKAETEAFKAQLKYESDKAKMESQERIAEQKNEVDLTIEQMKQGSNQIIE
jgi:hypothetical protein